VIIRRERRQIHFGTETIVWTFRGLRRSIRLMLMFIRQFIAAPLRVLAWVNGILKLSDPLPLAKAIWFLTASAADGSSVIVFTASTEGVDVARSMAEDIFSKKPDESIAAAIGWVELLRANNPQGAAEWVQRSRSAGCADDCSILHLELLLTDQLDGINRLEVIERILSRNDLPGHITRDALLGKARILLEERRFGDAEAIAKRILAIEENGTAGWVMWVARTAAGDTDNARAHIVAAQGKIRPDVFWGLVVLGWLYIGDRQAAMDVLKDCRQKDRQVAIVDRKVAELVGMSGQYSGDETETRQ